MSEFVIETSADRSILTIRLEGFWDMATCERFVRALEVVAGDANRVHTDYHTLVDARAFPVQRPDVAERMAGLVQSLADGGRGRTAVVARSALAGLQASRVLPSAVRVVVLDEDAARAWLKFGS